MMPNGPGERERNSFFSSFPREKARRGASVGQERGELEMRSKRGKWCFGMPPLLSRSSLREEEEENVLSDFNDGRKKEK